MVRRIILPLALLAMAGGCEKKTAEAGDQTQHISSEASSDAASPPNVNPTAAPGVAFTYGYDFELADDHISAVQEQHAARCEAMGVARCRITGLNYSLADDDHVSASLEVKLAPDLARQYGKDASVDVTKADGRLIRTQFEGTDTQPATQAADHMRADAAARIAELEKQLADPRTKDRERTELRQQIDQLQGRKSDANVTIADQQARLATTPMTFNYYGKGGIPGFGHQNPVKAAFALFIQSAVTMISVVLQGLAVVLPWLLLLIVVVAMVRSRIGRRLVDLVHPRRSNEDEAAEG